MVTYSTNFMGPVSIDWYRERGLTCKVTRVLTAECPLVVNGDNQAGDIFEFDDITVQCAGGRIDIRDSAKSGYDAWDEYSIAPMVEDDWHALGEYLWDLETETQLSYEQLMEAFELWYGKQVRWMEGWRPRAHSTMFDWKKPTTQMLGRWQPWHKGHQELFRRAFAQSQQVCIMIRDCEGVDDNPFDLEHVRINIISALNADGFIYNKHYVIIAVPNIVDISYGRGVGYTFTEHDLGEQVHNISATKIRAQMRKEGKL